MARIDRTKHESDIMERVFGGVSANEFSRDAFPLVEIETHAGLLASLESSLQIDALESPADRRPDDPRPSHR